MSALECVSETLRLGLEALEKELDVAERPEFWPQLWERYVETGLTSGARLKCSGASSTRAESTPNVYWSGSNRCAAKCVTLRPVEPLRVVFEQQYEVVQGEG